MTQMSNINEEVVSGLSTLTLDDSTHGTEDALPNDSTSRSPAGTAPTRSNEASSDLTNILERLQASKSYHDFDRLSRDATQLLESKWGKYLTPSIQEQYPRRHTRPRDTEGTIDEMPPQASPEFLLQLKGYLLFDCNIKSKRQGRETLPFAGRKYPLHVQFPAGYGSQEPPEVKFAPDARALPPGVTVVRRHENLDRRTNQIINIPSIEAWNLESSTVQETIQEVIHAFELVSPLEFHLSWLNKQSYEGNWRSVEEFLRVEEGDWKGEISPLQKRLSAQYKDKYGDTVLTNAAYQTQPPHIVQDLIDLLPLNPMLDELEEGMDNDKLTREEVLGSKNEEGLNALSLALQMGASEETVKVLAKEGGGSAVRQTDWNGHGALFYAYRYGFSQDVINLLQRLSLDAMNTKGVLTHYSNLWDSNTLKSNSDPGICLLFRDPFHGNSNGLQMALENRHPLARLQQILKSGGPSMIANQNDQGETAILVALRKYASPAIIRLLVGGLTTNNVTVNQESNEDTHHGERIILQQDKYGRNAVTVALERRASEDIIQSLTVENGNALISQQDKFGRNAIMIALKEDACDPVLKTLISVGSEDAIKQEDKKQKSVLHYAFEYGASQDICDYLDSMVKIPFSGNTVVLERRKMGNNALQKALLEDKLSMERVKRIAQVGGAAVVLNQNEKGENALFLSIKKRLSEEIVFQLIELGGTEAILQQNISEQLNAMMVAFQYRFLDETLNRLLDLGGHRAVIQCNKNKQNSLIVALQKSNPPDYFMNNEAVVSSCSSSDKILDMLINTGGKQAITQSDIFGQHALLLALEQRRSERVLEQLIQVGGKDVALQHDGEGISPIMKALELGCSYEVIDMLVEMVGKEGVMHQDCKGRNAIMIALEARASPTTIGLLVITAGIDAILQENISGRNAIQMAQELQSSNKILEVLKDIVARSQNLVA